MKAKLVKVHEMEVGHTRRLGHVQFKIEWFAKAGTTSPTKLFVVNGVREFKRRKDALDFCLRMANDIGGGECADQAAFEQARKTVIKTF